MTNYVIVDSYNLFFRARHVTRGDAFTKAGMCLHIMFKCLRKIVKETQADHLIFAIDGGSWRYKIYPEYKANRKMLRLQMTEAEKEEDEVIFAALNNLIDFLSEKTQCTVLNSPGVEGDDFVARWIELHPNDQHVILSGDSDFVQLLAPNVKIYDGVNARWITTTGVIDEKGRSLEFTIGSNTKLKIGSPNPKFVPETDWWKKCLFMKIVRGDIGDNIFSAYPKVRLDSKNKPSINGAWEDRHSKGFNWNNFMLQEWDKFVGTNPDGESIVKKVRVLDEYILNESLIDLSKQPNDVKELMDTVILQAVQKEPVKNIGFHFMKFCGNNSLDALANEAQFHAEYLNLPYHKD